MTCPLTRSKMVKARLAMQPSRSLAANTCVKNLADQAWNEKDLVGFLVPSTLFGKNRRPPPSVGLFPVHSTTPVSGSFNKTGERIRIHFLTSGLIDYTLNGTSAPPHKTGLSKGLALWAPAILGVRNRDGVRNEKGGWA